jgi:hypothetical protein
MRTLSIVTAICMLASQIVPALGDQMQDALDAIKREDFSRAYQLMRPLAENGDVHAQTGIGLMLYDGRGVEQNKAEAAKWFAKAADRNDVQAQAMLSQMYFLGEGGLPQSAVEAYKWALIAGDDATPILKFPKPLIEHAMRRTRKDEAIQLAEQWKFDKGLTKTPPRPLPADGTGVFFCETTATGCEMLGQRE